MSEIIMWPLSKLHNWENNPRAIKKEDFERLKKQIQELGQYKPLLIEPNGNVLGGNMRLRAYQELNIDPIWVSIIKPKNDAERVKYALSDNDRAGYYVEDELAELITKYQDEIDLSQYKVDLKEPIDLKSLLDQFRPIEEDEVPPLPEGEPISKLGEVYQLGRHRLVCGDATKIEDVEKLMDGKKADIILTDPPYGINLDSSFGGFPIDWENQEYKHKYEASIKGDDKPFDATFIFSQFNCKEVFLFGADYYANTIPNSGINGTWYVWDKREEENFDKMLGSPFEIIWGKQRRGKKIIRMRWASMFNSKATEGEKATKRFHPTQKPVALMAWFVKQFSKQDDIILDLFGGSGSTLIACEQTNRTCYMMEIDPRYCDVTRERYNNFVDKKQ